MPATLPKTDNYRDLFLNNTPLIDVRAPCEFSKGAFPHSINLPLMDDEDRHEIGIRYKQAGQDSAIELGHERVSGTIKSNRIQAWSDFISANSNAHLYCFRGGLRSRTSQQWIAENGFEIPLIAGGYKAMRRFLIDTLEEQSKQLGFLVLSGRTGTGKTRVLKQYKNHIDLEQLANHRGSSFGRLPDGQPSQIDFENSLSIAMLRASTMDTNRHWVEDESRLIGRCSVPLCLREQTLRSAIVVLEAPLETRTTYIKQDYVIDMLATYQQIEENEEAAWNALRCFLLNSISRIQKRLGGKRYQALEQLMESAISAHQNQNNLAGHDDWIGFLLQEYYDPMYDYQLSKKSERVIFRGTQSAIQDWYQQ